MGLLSKQSDVLENQLSEARRRIAELESELAQSATRDQLTESLLTLRAFRAQLELDVQRAHRYRRPLSVAIVDIDGFRSINLSHGYGAGDSVLVAVARVISESTRAHDLACRMGGDEFAVLLPETNSSAGIQAAERILLALEDLSAGPIRGLSASIGVAGLRPKQSPEQLLGEAHTALGQAQAGGGGRAAVHSGGEGPEEVSGDATHGDVVAALASALQERDQYTGDHSESVVDVAGRIAESLAMDEEQISKLRTAALLHDIGKVGVPDDILHKPGPLDEREWEIMRQHPVIGERILRAIPGLGAIAKVVRHEHERYDGKGYPDGLAGDDIPLGARIILACDAYHAMTSDRPYRAAMSHADALAELTRNAGQQFDPNVVEALVGYLYGRRQSGVTGL
ncbi:MAG TPA: diguanylate cyclase [Solirubrobacterales bacterium]|nr:diguanylate cyclase [Solirubrobacterales bacterium]